MKTLTTLFAATLLLATVTNTLAATHYVDVNSTNATPPFTNWPTAATNIQDAVDSAVAGDEVVVTNGIYLAVPRYSSGVQVDKPLSLRSVNGAQFTVIQGYAGPLGGIRCVYLTNGASLSGFTLTHGQSPLGGGVRCESLAAVVSNCVITGNRAFNGTLPCTGGGVYGGTLNNCTVTSNSVSLATSDSSAQLFGGGAIYSALNNCTVMSNSVTLNNNAPQGSTTKVYGAGAYQCTLHNCTVTGNSGTALGPGAYVFGAGTWNCALINCISFRNYVTTWSGSGCAGDCGSGVVAGNNCYGDPLFANYAGGDFRLAPNSPCINAGNNSYLTNSNFTNCFDLDGNPRIAGGTVDIGAYEFQAPVSQISYAWLQQYGLPINAGTDSADPDGDAVDNYHEWLAGTDPTNALSSPAQLTITPAGVSPGGIILMWSTNAVGFTLQSTTNLFSPVAWTTNSPPSVVIAGQNTVTNPITRAQQFYQLVH